MLLTLRSAAPVTPPVPPGTFVSATAPRLVVEVDFTNDPTNPTRVWTDITADVRQIQYTRAGRNTELQRTAAGTLSALLDNRAGSYDPTNPGSPYYPGVKRMRWIRVRAVFVGSGGTYGAGLYGDSSYNGTGGAAAVIYPRWQGLIETWNQSWPGAGTDATVSITATDAFKVLNLFDLNGLSFPAQQTSDRVIAGLAAAGITVSTVATGQTSIVADGPFSQGSSALSHLLQVEETENGLLYAEGDGTVVFQDRYYRLLHSGSSVATIGDVDGEIPYRDGELDLDDADVWNEVSVTPSGGVAQIADDLVSQASNYTRRLNRDSLCADAGEALSAAQYLVGLYGNPAPRIPQVEVLGAADTSKWPTILAAKNSDRFTWKRRASGHTISEDVFVEQVSDTVVPGTSWQVTFEMSPASAQTFWILENSTFSVLDTSTVPAY